MNYYFEFLTPFILEGLSSLWPFLGAIYLLIIHTHIKASMPGKKLIFKKNPLKATRILPDIITA
jgi:hypothetical protein